MNQLIEDLKAILKTTVGKIIIVIAAAASGSLGYVTDVFTDWSAGTQTTIEQVIENQE